MGSVNREKASEAFRTYISNYDATDGKIQLKIAHTFRVNELSERIAKSLGLPKKDVDIAWLIGLLHDIGRFEQIKDYGTFEDAKSVDHAKYGVKLLFPEAVEYAGQLMKEGMSAYEADACVRKAFPKSTKGKIREFLEDDSLDAVIYDAINYHNVFRLPTDLDENTSLFCKIIRDADKIDILKVNIDFPIETVYNASKQEVLTGAISPEVYQQFFQKTCIPHQLKKTAIDRYISHCSLTFELEFPISFQIVKEQGYLKKLFAFRNHNDKTNQEIVSMEQFMETFIEEHLGY